MEPTPTIDVEFGPVASHALFDIVVVVELFMRWKEHEKLLPGVTVKTEQQRREKREETRDEWEVGTRFGNWIGNDENTWVQRSKQKFKKLLVGESHITRLSVEQVW